MNVSRNKSIEVFTDDKNKKYPLYVAEKFERESEIGITIEDRRGEFMVVRTYIYNKEKGIYVLENEETTDVPSNNWIKRPEPFTQRIN